MSREFGHPRSGLQRFRALAALAGATAVLSVGGSALGGGAASAAGPLPIPTLYVNGATGSNSGSCQPIAHPCKTIGYALGEAPSGATIEVAPGIYPEQLTIARNVTIRGAGESSTIIEPTSLTVAETDADSDTAQAVIVDVAPGVSSANFEELQVNGSAASSSIPEPGADDYVGVYYRDASGSLSDLLVTQVEQQEGVFGDQPGPNGGVYVATDPGATAPTTGNGSPASWVPPPTTWAPSRVTMTGITVTDYDKDGITCANAGTVCSILGSTVTGLGPIPTNAAPWENNAQNGIEVWGASATVTGTTVSGNTYTSPLYAGPGGTYYSASGILVINAGQLSISDDTITRNDLDLYALWYPSWGLGPATQGAWSITGSTVSDATNDSGTVSGSTAVPFGYGVGDGIDVDGATGALVANNSLLGNPEYGIALFDASRSTITGNLTTQGAGDGIYVGDNPNIATNTGASTGNTISDNQSTRNGMDGILADVTVQDSGNWFLANSLLGNAGYDAQDLSTGSRTAGSANTWRGNVCQPPRDSSPEGLCSGL